LVIEIAFYVYTNKSVHLSCHTGHPGFDYVNCIQYLLHGLQHCTVLLHHIRDICCSRPGWGWVIQTFVFAFSLFLSMNIELLP